jgi:hypothetical protein
MSSNHNGNNRQVGVELRLGYTILAGAHRMTGICWDDSAHRRLACRAGHGPRIISCGYMTSRRRRGIPGTLRRCTWIIPYERRVRSEQI